MIDLRCTHHLHARIDPDEVEYHVRCQRCTKKTGVETSHRWTWQQVMDAQYKGHDVVWPCDDPEPEMTVSDD